MAGTSFTKPKDKPGKPPGKPPETGEPPMAKGNYFYKVSTTSTSTGASLDWAVEFDNIDEAQAYSVLANSMYAACTVKIGEIALKMKAGDIEGAAQIQGAINDALGMKGVAFPIG